jgi:hypothetical protein
MPQIAERSAYMSEDRRNAGCEVLMQGGMSPRGNITIILTDEDGNVLTPGVEERLKAVETRLTELANAMRELIRMRGRTDD